MANDLLTDRELSQVTGVPVNSRQWALKVTKVLSDAGIRYWLKANSKPATTWHHVHNLDENEKMDFPATPNFSSIK